MPCVVLNNNRGKVGWSTHLFFILWFLGMATIGYSQSAIGNVRSEEHTSELQSRPHLVCRLLLEKKKPITTIRHPDPYHRLLPSRRFPFLLRPCPIPPRLRFRPFLRRLPQIASPILCDCLQSHLL